MNESTESFRNFVRRYKYVPATRAAYIHWLRRFVEYCNKEEVVLRTGVLIGDNTDKLLFDNNNKIERLIKSFIDYQSEVLHLSPNTVRAYYEAVRHFYRSNNIVLNMDSRDMVGNTSNIPGFQLLLLCTMLIIALLSHRI